MNGVYSTYRILLMHKNLPSELVMSEDQRFTLPYNQNVADAHKSDE